ncbi:MAG: hypothetical protein PWQ88_642 [Candidatus Methanomethylophilaceae archaeon]|nr:hypothetical protein [Candidatus Methanomethylophilaceae archaeon]MDI3542267.1 hypothetical protein [Candidatus Methanomethylophilaceae archaeon]
MTELLEELEQKRNLANNDAEKHRRLRDELNKQTKEWVTKRDSLNSQVRELVDEAAKHRDLRDELNEKVREAKDRRDEWNKKVSELNELVNKLRAEQPKDKGPSLKKLKKELNDLEFRHMTSSLSKEKEQELIELMKKLVRQIEEKEKEISEDSELGSAVAELREAREQAEFYHRQVSEYAEKAQEQHDMMINLYDQADKLRKEADAAQEKFIETKLLADEEHRKHIEMIKQVHDYDKMISGLRQKQKKAKKKKEESAVMKEAESIFDKFKAGEKLSTEDLMTLQKSGYL